MRQNIILIGILLIVSSCTSLDQEIADLSTATFTEVLTSTSSPSPTLTSTETPVPPTDTPTITPTPPHPLSIEYLRQRSYDGGEIVIEDVLEPGSNYNRYYASYHSDGLKIYGLLTVPHGEPPETGWPAIVFNHGYIPPNVYKTTERYIAYVDNLARSGYIVFRVDYRGHDRSEGEANGAYGSPDYTIDVLNAFDALSKYPDADPNRIGMWGHSMGGHITLRAMVVNPNIKTGVIWAGVVGSYEDLYYNWRRYVGGLTPTPRPGSWRTEIMDQYGSPEENQAFWQSISANFFLADLSGPVQLHHGTADTSVPIFMSQTLYEQIQAVGGVVEYYGYEGDNHNLSNNFYTAMNRTLAFYDQYLKGISP